MNEFLSIWLLVVAVSVTVDLATSNAFCLGFTAGGILAYVAETRHASLYVQVGIFLLTSTLFLIFGYRWAISKLKGSIPMVRPQEQDYIGKILILDEDAVSETKIKIGGIYWTATVSEPLKKGEQVQITALNGTKFHLEKAAKGE